MSTVSSYELFKPPQNLNVAEWTEKQISTQRYLEWLY